MSGARRVHLVVQSSSASVGLLHSAPPSNTLPPPGHRWWYPWAAQNLTGPLPGPLLSTSSYPSRPHQRRIQHLGSDGAGGRVACRLPTRNAPAPPSILTPVRLGPFRSSPEGPAPHSVSAGAQPSSLVPQPRSHLRCRDHLHSRHHSATGSPAQAVSGTAAVTGARPRKHRFRSCFPPRPKAEDIFRHHRSETTTSTSRSSTRSRSIIQGI